jgi:uncharacterized membrane protein YphA (DoxX/SURF4 family)
LRVFFGSVFVFSGSLKLFHTDDFIKAISYYKLLPKELELSIALIIIISEIILGCLACFNLWAWQSIYILLLMLALFTLAMISAVIRGIDLFCGCFGPLEIVNRESNLRILFPFVRNGMLIVLGLFLIRNTRQEI